MKTMLRNLEAPGATRARRSWLQRIGRRLPATRMLDERPDWQQADAAWIRRALACSQQLPGGGWYVLDAARSFADRPRRVWLLGRALVVWRAGMQLMAASDVCPHLGAALSEGHIRQGRLVCPWHGLTLGPEGHRGWKPLETYDDGYLLWVRMSGAEVPSPRPHLPLRPDRALHAVIRIEAACEPRDVLANRLDPWHGAHYHPHSFARLKVIDQREDAITVRVAYRLIGPLAVEVDARFHCPDPRSIVMTIVRGEGEGSVVETHATPIAPGRCAIVELTLASSERRGFAWAKRADGLLRPAMQWAARRLWREDARYAERLHELRRLQVVSEPDTPRAELRS
jgi:isorenieratene synthase